MSYTGNEWNLSDVQRASISAVVFSGQLVGGFETGPIADRFGRKRAFLLASFLIVTFGFLSGFSKSYEGLLLYRVVVGFGLGGLTVPFDLLAEFLPATNRGKYLLYIEYFWTLGSIFVTGIAWVALDRIGWRGLAISVAFPVTLCSIVSFLYLPESPRWLLIKGRIAEAESIVKEAAAAGGAVLLTILPPTAINSQGKVARRSSLYLPMEDENVSYVDLVATPNLRAISFSLWIIWTSFGFTYYGIILLVTRLNTEPPRPYSPDYKGPICEFDYEDIFYNATAEFVGVFLTALVIDSWGRNRTQAYMYTAGGIAVLMVGFQLPTASLSPYVAMVARMAAMASSSATWVCSMSILSPC